MSPFYFPRLFLMLLFTLIVAACSGGDSTTNQDIAEGVSSAGTTSSSSNTGSTASGGTSTEADAEPSLILSADQASVSSGSSIRLNWTATDTDVCTASGDWSGIKADSGSQTVGPLMMDSVFTLECDSAQVKISRSVYVTVSEPLPGGTLAELTLVDTRSGSGRAYTVGVPIGEGVLPSGTSLVVTKADGTVLTSQWNELAQWRSDGSALHGVLTFLTPNSGGNDGTYYVKTGTGFSGAAISKADVAAAGFDATVSVTVGGTSYRLSAADLLDGTVQPRQDYTHFTGTLASEFVVGGSLRQNGMGAEHATLQAYFYIRAFKNPVDQVHVTVVLENTGAFNAISNVAASSVDVQVGGASLPVSPRAILPCMRMSVIRSGPGGETIRVSGPR